MKVLKHVQVGSKHGKLVNVQLIWVRTQPHWPKDPQHPESQLQQFLAAMDGNTQQFRVLKGEKFLAWAELRNVESLVFHFRSKFMFLYLCRSLCLGKTRTYHSGQWN